MSHSEKIEDWEEKVRKDYKGIISDAQIEATVLYWRKIMVEALSKRDEEWREKKGNKRKPFNQACSKCYLGDCSVDLCSCHYVKEICPCHILPSQTTEEILKAFDRKFPIMSFYGEPNETSKELEGKFTRDTKELPIEIKSFLSHALHTTEERVVNDLLQDIGHSENRFCKKFGEQFRQCAKCYIETYAKSHGINI